MHEKASEHDKRFNQIIGEIKRLHEKVAEHDKRFDQIIGDLKEVKRFQDKLAVSMEEEAHEVVEYLLETRYNLRIKLDRLVLDRAEVNIYGVSNDLCVFGEVSVRLGLSMIKELLNKVRFMKRKMPEYLRSNIILVLYGLRILPDVIKEAEKKGIWIVTATRELTKLRKLRLSEI